MKVIFIDAKGIVPGSTTGPRMMPTVTVRIEVDDKQQLDRLWREMDRSVMLGDYFQLYIELSPGVDWSECNIEMIFETVGIVEGIIKECDEDGIFSLLITELPLL